MSTELKGTTDRNGAVQLTRFATAEGPCLQVTGNEGKLNGFVSLTKAQALELAVALVEFANGTREEDEGEGSIETITEEIINLHKAVMRRYSIKKIE